MTSLLATRGSGKEKLIEQRRVWTCLEIVLWSKSNLCCQNICSSVHTNQQLQINPLANTIHEPAMAGLLNTIQESVTAGQSIRNHKDLPIPPSPGKWQEAASCPCIIPGPRWRKCSGLEREKGRCSRLTSTMRIPFGDTL